MMMMMWMIMMTNDDDGFSDIFRGFQVSEIAEAVEEVKQFVRPTREKVLDQFNFSTWIIDIFNAVILFGNNVEVNFSQRFRKRDQVWFHGRKLIRRVEDSVK